MVGKSDSTKSDIYNQESIEDFNPGGAEEAVFPFPSTAAGVLCPSFTASLIKGTVSTLGMLS